MNLQQNLEFAAFCTSAMSLLVLRWYCTVKTLWEPQNPQKRKSEVTWSRDKDGGEIQVLRIQTVSEEKRLKMCDFSLWATIIGCFRCAGDKTREARLRCSGCVQRRDSEYLG